MPVYNASAYLEDCLNSIVKQTEINWELIAIDDFSKDNSADILAAFAEWEPRIKWKTNTAKGIIPALQNGLKFSNGTFITRMDADDLMKPDKLKKLKSILVQHGKGHLATAKVEYFSASQLGNGYIRYQDWLNQLCIEQNHYSNIYKECVIPSPCWMMHLTDLENIGSFDGDQYPEDYDLCFRMYQHKLKAIAIPEVLHMWRDHPERASRNDDNYTDNRFFDIKLKYFLSLDYSSTKRLVVMGAGKKAKYIAAHLSEQAISYEWYCDNPNKIGQHIYATEILNELELYKRLGPDIQIIIAISNPTDQLKIKQRLVDSKLLEGRHFYFWC